MKKLFLLGLMITGTAAAQTNLTGAGASFPYPLYSKMFAEYKKASGVDVNYQSVGSGAGQKQIVERTVDFAGSDNPMSDEAMQAAPGKLLHIPTAIGAVVPAYNLPGVSAPLKFTGKVLADIYLGKITTWNDKAIAALNPGVTIPPLRITVARRSDGSGTTYVFSDYLSKVSSEWKNKVGVGNSLQWPVGTGAKGNDGVAGIVKSTPGALGYVELVYARQNKLTYGSVQNHAGKFVLADNGPAAAAAQGVVIPADTRVSLTNSANADAYPIASFTYVIFYQDQKYGSRTEAQAKALKNLLTWMVTTGQGYNEALDYAKLPANVANKARGIINSMTYGGKKI
ncbi:phosphate ABC transporter substrate-binding protein PstS [Deinococcus metallilatus]|uniref:Phosphate-binding protein n=1 Tax=Deinococcus metallilatus TaxID=1211322 RepID=A0AAJ5F1L1_9DEIO|nr:phosphate ABC transporter substrate-binding protein PstS [Deinococcus metallilatus]MBB5296642.1 phosphate transport system substrate-binding protein [Deinococcus metallilatus]QBY09267.1 phosphate ABC transporter substrate-binding protein PstS [Deinococcus metallilatus]RXJ09788.1 phosphate ABC transporter substrate-binding protein PstS [Deinococcus metallilatus]TLK24254.1 phosphate ABC transporter substrate-binding protein PstS [Deinococcus metallilatus]GMA13672.1 phosphate-binding protein [